MSFIKPYDTAIQEPWLSKVRERRKSPDGFQEKVTVVNRRGVVVNKYPWDKLKPGDFFIVPLHNKRSDLLKNTMYQVARSRDAEIVCVNWNDRGVPSIRVTLVFYGLRAIKLKAIAAGVTGIRLHDRTAFLKRKSIENSKSYYKNKENPSMGFVEAPSNMELIEPPKNPPSKPHVRKNHIFGSSAEIATDVGDEELALRRAELMRLRGQSD